MGNNYKKLEEHFRKIYALDSAMAILGWDAATYMQEGSSEYRANSLSSLASMSHNMSCSDELKGLIDKSSKEQLNDWQKANLREIKLSYEESKAVPENLIAKYVKSYNECEVIWRNAKKQSDFGMVRDQFKSLVDIMREIAREKSDYFGLSKYESMVMSYDYGRSVKDLESYFGTLEKFLPNFIDETIEKQKDFPNDDKIAMPKDIQRQICLSVMKDLGFDFTKGRIDESMHPFCGGVYGDVRITTNYDESDAIKSITAVIHETGHAIYEQNLPKDYYDQPVGHALGMSIHESQSLFYEMQVGSSIEFCEYLSKKIKDIAKIDITAKRIWNAINKVERSFIRIYADEVTYPLHVIMRYRIEKSLIESEIEVDDIPGIWNDMMNKYLKRVPKKDSEGCLQDIHWYSGSIGYFPSYSIGAMTAAQLFKASKIKLNSKDIISNFADIKKWLNNNIHSYGRFYDAEELIKNATEKKLDANIYIDYLQNKYRG